jgi:RNA polymerase sigma factor (sigma-70 family)
MPQTQSNSNSTLNCSLDLRTNLVTESFTKYHVYLVDHIYRLCGSHDLAEEVIQELWIHVYGSFKTEHIGCLPILRRKAWQKYVDHYRKIRRLNEVNSELVVESIEARFSTEPFNESEEEEMEQNFWSEFPEIDLTEAQKKVIWLHARYGYTYAEIEKKMGVTTSTICDWLQKARTKIPEYLGKDFK